MLADTMAAIDMIGDAVSVLIVGDQTARLTAHEDVAAIGGRISATVGWSDVIARAPLPAARSIVLIDARDVGEDILVAALPMLDAWTLALDLPAIIDFTEEAIDVVTAAMFGPHVQLLCDPTATERGIALIFGAQQLGFTGIHERTRENEAARLQRLNAEVARIADVLSRISARENGASRPLSMEVAERSQDFAEPSLEDIAIEPAEIRRAIRARRLRDRYFGKGVFEEPGWDIMLDLFAAELEQVRVSVSSLCIAAAVAPTTALRWVSKLTEAGLLVRQPDPFDRRRAYMELSERASRAMRDYMAAMRRAGLSLA